MSYDQMPKVARLMLENVYPNKPCPLGTPIVPHTHQSQQHTLHGTLSSALRNLTLSWDHLTVYASRGQRFLIFLWDSHYDFQRSSYNAM